MHKINVIDKKGKTTTIEVNNGANLRKELLKNNLSPYTRITSKLNCKGNGICATCGVFILQDVKPKNWHDKLAATFHYPRLSCQITVSKDLDIIIPDKVIWGKRNKNPGISDL